MLHVFVVIAESGSYSDRCEWIAGIFTSRDEALKLAGEHKRKADSDGAAYTAWCNARSPLYWQYLQRPEHRGMGGVLTNEEEAEISKAIGPKPNNGAEADDFYIIEVPMGTWGAYNDRVTVNG